MAEMIEHHYLGFHVVSFLTRHLVLSGFALAGLVYVTDQIAPTAAPAIVYASGQVADRANIWGPVVGAMVGAVVPTIALITTNRRINDKVDQVHITMNSRLDELVRLTKSASFAEGRLAGISEQKASIEASGIVDTARETAATVVEDAKQVAAGVKQAAEDLKK